ncbi:MAG: hypothetical protein ACFFED_06280 [Candidatus Thorarchaeota archaeon]
MIPYPLYLFFGYNVIMPVEQAYYYHMLSRITQSMLLIAIAIVIINWLLCLSLLIVAGLQFILVFVRMRGFLLNLKGIGDCWLYPSILIPIATLIPLFVFNEFGNLLLAYASISLPLYVIVGMLIVFQKPWERTDKDIGYIKTKCPRCKRTLKIFRKDEGETRCPICGFSLPIIDQAIDTWEREDRRARDYDATN